MATKIRIPGFTIKDGKVVHEMRRLSVCDRLKQQCSARVRVKRASGTSFEAQRPEFSDAVDIGSGAPIFPAPPFTRTRHGVLPQQLMQCRPREPRARTFTASNSNPSALPAAVNRR